MKQNSIKEKSLLLTTMLVLSANVSANLPDEIDYKSYFEKYQTSKYISDDARANADQIMSLINDIKNELSENASTIHMSEEDIVSLRNLIARLQNDNVNLEDTIAELSQDNSDISNRLNYLANEINDAQRIENRLKNETRIPLQREATLLRSIRKVNHEISKVENDLKPVRQEVKRLKSKISSLESSIQSNKTEKIKLEKKASTIDSDISLAESSKNQAQTKVSELTPKKNKLQNKVQSIGAELRTVAAELASETKKDPSSPEKIAELKNKKVAIQKKLTQTSNRLKKVDTELKKNQTKLSNSTSKLAKLQKAKQDLPNKVTSVKNALKNDRAELKRKKSRLEVSKRERQSLRGAKDALLTEKSSYDRRLKQTRIVLAELTRRIKDTQDSRVEMQNESNRLVDRRANNNQVIVDSDATIKSNKNTIVNSEDDIESSKRTIRELSTRNNNLEVTLSSKESDYVDADTRASELEGDTDERYSAFQKRNNLYKSYKVEAQKLGQSQGDTAGDKVGEFKGGLQLDSDAKKFGTNTGTKIGELKGYLAGLIEGKEKGLDAGYEAGSSSKDSYDSGYAKGFELGIAKAKEVAKNESYPLGFASMRDALLEDEPTSIVNLSNSAKTKSFLEKSFASLTEMTEVVEETVTKLMPTYERTSELIDEVADSKIDLEISKVKQAISELENNPEIAKSRPLYAYTSPTKINIEKNYMNCRSVYKSVKDYLVACEESYENAFEANFTVAHKEVYFEGYVAKFDTSSSKAEAANLKKDEAKGYKKAYKVAYAEAKIRGEGDAYKAGVEEGRGHGYEQNIEQQRIALEEQGIADAKSHFSMNPVVRLADSGQTSVKFSDARGLVQNTKFSLGLGLANFGQKAASKGAVTAKVIATTNNVEVENKIVNLRDLPADSKVNLVDVFGAKVKNNAKPGTPVEMKLKLIYPGDNIASSYSEVATFSSSVVVNPEVTAKYGYASEVKDRKCTLGLFKCRFRTHYITVSLVGQRDYIPGQYKVDLQILEGSQYVKKAVSTKMINSPGFNQVNKGSVAYKFKSKTKKNKLKFKVIVSYKGKVLDSKVINILAK